MEVMADHAMSDMIRLRLVGEPRIVGVRSIVGLELCF
jgi:hypothetical protein